MKYFTILVLLLMFTSCGIFGSDDDTSDIPGKIVFAADDEVGNSQIFTMNAEGLGVKQLTHLEDGQEAYQPTWSPDGSQIVFSTSLQSSSNGLSLYLMAADGSNMRPLHERENSHIPTPGSYPRWSPDGTKIAWHQCVNCQLGTNYELFVYDVTADSVTRLTDNRTSEAHPTWSPDGSRIAFVSNRDYVDADTLRFRKDLYMMNVDGSSLQRLTETGFAREPLWHPTGNTITFRSTDSASGLYSWIMQSQNITKIKSDLSDRIHLHPNAWSTGGEQLLITAKDLDQSQNTTLYIYELKNNELNSVYSKGPINNADWYITETN